MPSTRSRRRILLTCGGLFTATLSGCLGDSAPDDRSGGGDTDDQATTSQSPPSTVDGPTAEPATVSDSDAKRRALRAEGAYLESRLENASCVEQWSWYSPTSEDDAEVTGRSADRVLVTVRHSYSYTTETTEADAYSNARYAVGPDEVERLSGDEVSPC